MLPTPSIVIDVSVAVPPPVDSDADSVRAYVGALAHWSALLQERWLRTVISESGKLDIYATGLAPTKPALERLLGRNGVVEYDAQTVYTLVLELLQRTGSLESLAGLSEVLFERPAIEPEGVLDTEAPMLRTQRVRGLVMLALLQTTARGPGGGTHFGMLLPGLPGPTRVMTTVKIIDVEAVTGSTMPALEPPVDVTGDTLACSDLSGLLLGLDEVEVWSSGLGFGAREAAVRIATAKLRHGKHLSFEWFASPRFRLGRRFTAIADDLARSAPKGLLPRLLRSMSEAMDGTNPGATHALRVSPQGGSPQRSRTMDGAKAWRRDVCGHEYHLHYWVCPGGMIEFASVGPHNNFDIPE